MNNLPDRFRLLKFIWLIGCLIFLGLFASSRVEGQGAAPASPPAGNCQSESIPAIYERVSPSVVFISAISINPYKVNDRVEHIVGSGFIIDPSGLVLTNSHVAFNRQVLVVILDDGTSVPAQLVGADPVFDIAVLRIPGDKLPSAALGDSNRVRVGEDVLTIGNPLGLDQSLTRGVVSAINRIMPETFFSLQEPLIQIDAPINPGNSGGPLLNRCGEVIGITTSMIPNAANIGFSIPINLAKSLMPSLIARGRVIRPWLGFHGQFIESDLQNLLRVPLVEGFLVEVVEPGSPAEKAGLHGGQLEMTIAGRALLIGGDIITRINGTPVDETSDQMIKVLRDLKVGNAFSMTIFRDGKYLDIKYVLPERPLLPGDIPEGQLVAPLKEGSIQRTLPHHLIF